MFVLHVELKVKSGSQANLEKTFVERFYRAISAQSGFVAAELLRSNDDETSYRLCLSFDQWASQQKWVATDLHQEVWPLVEDLCENYAVAGYTAI
ncbi:antibiotic biosynthesis monooxygenase family protein [Edaphobacter modestus]|uniref:Heme-degrading monooxygenase HmoA n=1 Tax=Edaphobacter modestus TaxID=388466 RepID=A0A4Q7Z126_9BACT|nr:antibiotic biosynthesis monooxygenase family protein [Edaphobacter modestus]RZU43189.1 heme-degrading monooxygenase HmoA [Edaphobacter modestus]